MYVSIISRYSAGHGYHISLLFFVGTELNVFKRGKDDFFCPNPSKGTPPVCDTVRAAKGSPRVQNGLCHKASDAADGTIAEAAIAIQCRLKYILSLAAGAALQLFLFFGL